MAEQTNPATKQPQADRVVDGVVYRLVDGQWKPMGTVLERQAARVSAALDVVRSVTADISALRAQDASLDQELAAGPQNTEAANNAAQQYASARDELATTQARIAEKRAALAARGRA